MSSRKPLETDDACPHEWFSFGTLDTNPEQHFRKCMKCNRVERHDGVTYLADGGRLPATEWEEAQSAG